MSNFDEKHAIVSSVLSSFVELIESSHLTQSLSIDTFMLLLCDEGPWLDLGLECSGSIGTARP